MVTLPLLLAGLAPLVRARRKQAGYSQERFASVVGVHRTYMGSIERGGAANPTLKVLDAIARRLDLDLLQLLTLAVAGDGNAEQGTSAIDTPAPGTALSGGPADKGADVIRRTHGSRGRGRR